MAAASATKPMTKQRLLGIFTLLLCATAFVAVDVAEASVFQARRSLQSDFTTYGAPGGGAACTNGLSLCSQGASCYEGSACKYNNDCCYSSCYPAKSNPEQCGRSVE